MNVLTSLGVYEDVRKRALEVESTSSNDAVDHPVLGQHDDDMRGWFKYLSGMGNHELVCDVSQCLVVDCADAKEELPTV